MIPKSPIIVFTYLRIESLKKTIQCLSSNKGAQEYDLYIFSDGPRFESEISIIGELRKYLKTISGFKSVTISESEFNNGLSKSVINGVSEILEMHESAIILEDDLITSTNFLEFMNLSINFYKDKTDVVSISGYSFPNIHSDNFDVYLLNRSWSWGWATWKNRWEGIDWHVSNYAEFSKSNNKKKQFAALGSDVNLMLKKQMNGQIDSWLIRFVFHQFQVKGKTVYPAISKVTNNGWDEFASNNKGSGYRFKTDFDTSGNLDFKFTESLEIEPEAMRNFLSKNGIWERIKNKLIDFSHFF